MQLQQRVNYRYGLARLLKQVVNEAAGEKTPEA
jgi:hypothetical protein